MAQRLTPLPLRGPGRFGLNTEQAAAVADPRWALELTNAVFDDAGRIAARKGMNLITTGTASEDPTGAVHEYIKDRTTKEIISAGEGKIWRGTTTVTDITGTISTPTTDNWKFVNFNGKVLGVQQGDLPIVYSGTSFSDLAGEGIENGNCILAAWGRVWIADEDQKGISVSDLLDETAYTINLDLQNYWPDGQDLVIGIEEWQDRLLVFGERSILIFKDPDTIGDLTPAISLEDTIDSGALSCDAIVRVGTDLIYLSQEGLRSVNRAIQYESLPASILSTNVRDALVDAIASASPSEMRMAYSEAVGGIICKIGVSYFYFDRKYPLETGDLRASSWDNIDFYSIHATTDGTVYFGAGFGGLGKYEGYTDQTDPEGAISSYNLRFSSTWLEAEGREFIPKSARIVLVTSSAMDVQLRWSFDFEDTTATQLGNTGTTAPLYEWGNDGTSGPLTEWFEAEWQESSFQIRRVKYNLTGAGERLQIGVRILVTGEVSVAQIDLYTKLGRMAA